jgi:hypothetical protein
MAPTILQRGLSIFDFFNFAYRSFEIWFIFYKMDCQSNAKPSEKDYDLPGIRTRDLWISSQHCYSRHHLGRRSHPELQQKIWIFQA